MNPQNPKPKLTENPKAHSSSSTNPGGDCDSGDGGVPSCSSTPIGDRSRSTTPRPCITDWNICVICQKKTDERLVCPADSKRQEVGAGYKSCAKNLLELNGLESLPVDLDIERLDDGEGIEATLIKNKAKWHKTCRDRYNQTRITRARKRKQPETGHEDGSGVSRKTQSSFGEVR